jgi:hypothetical protein
MKHREIEALAERLLATPSIRIAAGPILLRLATRR